MSAKLFHIYKSSAGSGKTRTLAKEYLLLALRFRADYFKHILAVTFTNKATQEMKDRILDYLDDFAKGEENNLTKELIAALNYDPNTFQLHAQEVQGELLHHYSQFSISTIDAFFQRVIRSFTRETGLMGDFRLEIETDMVLEEVIDNLIDELKEGTELTKWVVEFAKSNLENERSWDIRRGLKEFAEQIFKEEFKMVEGEIAEKVKHPSFFKDTRENLFKLKHSFLATIQKKAIEAVTIIEKNNLVATDFSYTSGTPYTFFKTVAALSSISKYEVGSRLTTYFNDVDKWGAKKSDKQQLVNQLAKEKLAALLTGILEFSDQHLTKALSAEVALNNFYAFGLITDIARKLREYKDQNNLMLLADAPQFLNGIIQDSDTPFIYEKVGSFYKNYLIDEFQDTSGFQWANFKPLLMNSLDEGYQGMLVGDVKQAVYRWRGGDLSLLQNRVLDQVGEVRVAVHELDKNYRSTPAIVDFNNTFFDAAAKNIVQLVDDALPEAVFETARQGVTRTDVAGFVKVEFLEWDKDEGFEDLALDKLVTDLESIQDAGVPLKDIAILVRKNSEGQKIAQHLLQKQSTNPVNSIYRYDVVSNESLIIDGAASVKLLLGAMRYLLNHDDSVARAQLAYEYARLFNRDMYLNEVFEVGNATTFENMLPEKFVKQKRSLKKLPLFEMTESLIGIFKLGDQLGELPFIQAFQDVVLGFYTREKNDLGAFLEWWEENRFKKSIQVPEEIDAIRILTIHKSKGLQFKVVMIPFCDWNLDHENMKQPTLWVKSVEPEFEAAGFLPINYSSTLERTFFHSFYKEEKVRTYVDNLNLLYVALTRAEEGLYLTAPKDSRKEKKINTTAQLLQSTIAADVALSAKWKITGLHWEAGEKSFTKPKTVSNEDGQVTLTAYRVTDWRQKMVIRQSGKTFFNQEEDVAQQKRLEGIHMHLILSRIHTAADLDASLDKMCFDGVILEEDKISLREKLEILFTNKKIKSWFDPEWTVRTEVPLLLPEKGERRIDRLITSGNTAVVIDFKTGDPSKKDQEQVRDYIQWLYKMNFAEVNGFLLYLKTNQVVNVSLTRSKVSKVKDENQLGLGL